MRAGHLLLLALLQGGCEPIRPPVFSTDSGEDYDPDYPILVSDASLDFGAVVVNDIAADALPTLELTLTNLGAQERPVYGYALVEGDDDAFWVDAEPYFTLAGGASRTLPVRFRPQTAASYSGRFVIEGGSAAVTLAGQGLAPVIALESHEPAGVSVGCEETFTVEITNTGDEPLALSGAQLKTGVDFTLPEPLATQTLAVGQHTQLSVRFDPVFSWSASAERLDELEIRSDDPRTPRAHLPLSVLSVPGSLVEEQLTYYPGGQVDLLLMVDNTGVMATRLQKAADAIPVLTRTLLGASMEANVAVVTGGEDCPTTRPAWRSSRTSSEEELNALLSGGLWGSSGSGSTRLLMHAVDALDNTGTGACLSGFLRPGAILHVVVLSGQNDSSGYDVDEQLDALWAAAPDARAVMVSTVVGTDPGGCSGMSYGVHYLNAALLTDGVQGSACDSDWSAAFEEMALSSAALATGSADHPLETEPVPETLRVTVEGSTFTGWSYSATPPTLHFLKNAAPATGSLVEVDYLAAVPCSTDDTAR